MQTSSRRPSLVRLTLSFLISALLAATAVAQVAKPGNDVLSSLAFVHERLQAAEQVEPLGNMRSVTAKSLQDGWDAFRLGAGPAAEWQASIDKRTGLVAFAEGGGVAWIPGRGNTLTTRDLGAFLKSRPAVDLDVLDAIARDFLPRVQSLLGIDPAQLVLNRARSGQPAGHVWFVDYDVVREGMVIEGARVVFRVNNGNLIQVGTENLPVPGALLPPSRLTAEEARAAVARYIGGFQAGDALRDTGSLHLVPAAILSSRSADGYDFGNGRGLAKIWRITFKRPGVMGTWQAEVDATSGEVLSFDDANKYVQALVSGGVYLESPATGGEVVRPFADADVSTGGFANGGGIYTYTSGAVTSALQGRYVKITDTCGAIAQAADPSGNIAFGTSTGTDCITPGHGGAGNTHAAREQFYQVDRIKGVVRGWLPANTWINSQLNVNVNLNQTCNAYWDGAQLNFFKSGGGCANTGEIAGISLHELGHGIDQNDGNGTTADSATGETYGDTTALLALHDSCVGAGFLTSNCAGYGDACTACTGVRDVDYARHSANTPATADNFIRVHCPAAIGSAGPCGKEFHCESEVPTETMWDLAARDLPGAGTSAAWTILDRLWYLSRGTATQSFSCTAGTTYTSNGCGAGSLWKVFRAIDDDDGNLTNGTPHGGALFAAFNRHGIACATDTGAATTFAGCTPPATPTLAATAGNNSVALAWTASGSAVYDVFRNDVGCDAGFTKIASAATPTSLTDGGVANGFNYYYQVTAFPSGNESCASLPSSCVAVPVPVPGCTPPAAPAGVTASVARSVSTATITLAWSAVTGATEYHIYRATTSGGPYTLAGTSTAASFTDPGLSCGFTYDYVIRAATSSTCESINSAQIAVPVATCDCAPHTLYSNTFDSATGLSDWTVGTFATGGSTASWRGVKACAPTHSGTKIFHYGGAACTGAYGNNEFNYAQPKGATGLVVPTGAVSNRLSFWHRRQFESGFDGAMLTISVDGTNYFFVPATAIVSGTSYNGTLSASCPPAGMAGAAVFTGASTIMTNTLVDLDAACNAATGTTTGCGGRTIHIGFTSITDCSTTGTGWFLDDVTVTSCY
jgi:trimeric autotransporter adhesin